MSETQWDGTDRAEAEAIDGIDVQRERWANRTEAEREADEAWLATMRERHPVPNIVAPF